MLRRGGDNNSPLWLRYKFCLKINITFAFILIACKELVFGRNMKLFISERYNEQQLSGSNAESPSVVVTVVAQDDVLHFKCPSSLMLFDKLEEHPWQWEINVTNDVINRQIVTIPQVVLISLPREKNATYLNTTRKSLMKNNYSNFCESNAVDGIELSNSSDVLIPTMTGGLSFVNKMKVGKWGPIGCFLSHLAVWRLGFEQNIPIIALESDTFPLTAWRFNESTYKDYDILFIHDHSNIAKHCASNSVEHIREGHDFWYATGAMLFTNNNREKVERVWREELSNKVITMPIGHWYNKMWSRKKLKIGSLCPHTFRQDQNHISTMS